MDADGAMPQSESSNEYDSIAAEPPQMMQGTSRSLFGTFSAIDPEATRFCRSRPLSFRFGISALLPSSSGNENSEAQRSKTTFEATHNDFASTSHPENTEYYLPSPATTIGTSAPLLTPRTDSQNIAPLALRKAELRHQRAWKRKRRNRQAYPRWTSKTKTMHSTHLLCIVFGVVLASVIVTYFALTITLKTLSVPLNITFILLLIISTILFFHAVVRLCLHRHKFHRKRYRSDRHTHSHSHHHHHHHPYWFRKPTHRQPRLSVSTSYPPTALHPSDLVPQANVLYTPTTPVRVHLARDEEADLDADLEEATLISPLSPAFSPVGPASATAPPPAYGLWRCSVRADPNLLHWARVGEVPAGPTVVQAQEASTPRSSMHVLGPAPAARSRVSAPIMPSAAVPRPPSYASDDGVQYVLRGLREPGNNDGDGRGSLFGAIDVSGTDTGGATLHGRDEARCATAVPSVVDDWPLRSAVPSVPVATVRESEAVRLATRQLLAE